MTDATLFVGGHVLTGSRRAEALLIEDGRVVAVGPEPVVRPAAPTGADRVELAGGLVVPGLADAHLHLGDLTRVRQAVDASQATSLAALRQALVEGAATREGGAVVGVGLDPERLAERRWPTAEELDAAAPGRPVVLYHASGHAAVASTAVLHRVDRSGGTTRPPGVLLEEELEAVAPLVAEALPLSAETMEVTLREIVSLGIVAVGTMSTSREELAVLGALSDAGHLPLRVHAYPHPEVLGEPELMSTAPRAAGRLRVSGVKIFLDGAFGPRTASLVEAYADDPSTHGVDRGGDGELAETISDARASGLVPALHAIGDRAVARAVRLLGGSEPKPSAGRIEHASLTPPPLLGALQRAGFPLVVQPGFILSDLWLRERLGRERARWAYAFRTLHDHGIPLAGSSDAPYDRLDPWEALRAALHRQDPLGRSANPSPDERLSEPEALGLYTLGAHRALGEAEGGNLEVGARADLVVLRAPRLVDAIRAGRAAVRETWVEGRRSFRAEGPR